MGTAYYARRGPWPPSDNPDTKDEEEYKEMMRNPNTAL